MKSSIALLCVLGLLVSAHAQTPPAKVRIDLTPPPPKDTTKDGKAEPKAGAKKDVKKEAKKEEPPAKIEGIEIPRAGGGFLGIEIVNATFKLSFYDAKKKPVAPDVARAVLRWDPKYKVGSDRVVLNPSGKALTSERTIRPPYHFKLFITLLKEPVEGADAVASENHVVDFRS